MAAFAAQFDKESNDASHSPSKRSNASISPSRRSNASPSPSRRSNASQNQGMGLSPPQRENSALGSLTDISIDPVPDPTKDDEVTRNKTPPTRLNPKLTARRRPEEPPPIEVDFEAKRKGFLREIGALALDSDRSDDEGHENKRRELMHTGQWIPTRYNLGRPIKFTGQWGCCGKTEKHSLYCDSLEARETLQLELEMDKMVKRNEEEYKKDARSRDAPEKYELKLRDGETAEDLSMKQINSPASAYNAPMLMSWLIKHIKEEHTATNGLKLLLKHVQTGEGCQLMYTHGAVDCCLRASQFYRNCAVADDVQLDCISILRQLLDCNFTRDAIICDTRVLRAAFNIGHTYMSSKPHVEQAVQCVMQCSRSETCRADIIDRKLHLYLTLYCKRYSQDATILRPVLKTFNWITTSANRIILLCQDKAVSTVINCMRRHMNNSDVLGPGMLFLTRASTVYPLAMEKIIKMNAVSIIIGALKALFDNEVLQLEGLKMIQQLSKTSEGWAQIENTRGGWQTICQGTTLGNSLLHDLPGSFHNPGWGVGDTHNVPIMDRDMAAAKKVLSLRNNMEEKSGYWTANTLQEYMGVSHGKHSTLSVNTAGPEAYFQLIKTLDLLPKAKEEKEYWFIRVGEYEKANEIKINEMVDTVLSMKKKEQDRLKEEQKKKDFQKTATGEDYVKPLYVMGERVTTDMMDRKDIAMEEQLAGVTDS